MINLLYMTPANRGGWATYASHVYHGLEMGGYNPTLWHIVAKQPGIQPHNFGRGISYRQATVQQMIEVLRRGELVHILAADPKRASEIYGLLDNGASITIHDPTELTSEMCAALTCLQHPVTIIRESMYEHLGFVKFVPHPYIRMPDEMRGQQKQMNAVAFSRIDFDKGTHHIAAANRKVTQDKWCWLYGFEHRPYAQHKLSKVDPNWREYHGGNWGTDDLWYGVKLAEMANMVIDMSVIKGDGGGTQYTHLEGLDGCRLLVLNEESLTGKSYDDELLRVAEFVKGENLSLVLDQSLSFLEPKSYDENLRKFFANHDARIRAPQVIGL